MPPTPPDPRRIPLERMRRIAGAVLAGMAVLLVLAAAGRRLLPGAGIGEALGWVQAFAEAGLAGGLADWFAVTALFRRPLGLPIPHTAIIPRNRDRIGRALGGFIAGQLVTPTLVERALERFDPAALLPGLIARTPRPQLERLLASALQAGLGAAPLAPTAGAVLARLWTPERSGVLVRRAVRLLARTLESRHDELRDTLVSHGTGWTPRFVDRMLADRVLAALGGVLTDLEAPGHPWRGELDRLVQRLAGRLADDPGLAVQAERWKAELLAGDAVAAMARTLAERLATDPPVLDADSAAALNRTVREGLRDRILSERPALADLISERMKDWNEAAMVSELELQAGRDLQYIRINGALVGGAVGLVIHGVLKQIGG